MNRRNPPLAALLFLPALAALAGSGEPPGETSGPAAAGAGLPRAGEWIEYVVAFPRDPLEDAVRAQLRAGDGAAEAAASGGAGGRTAFDNPAIPVGEPAFDPEITWQTMPLRLEILKVSDDGCQAAMTYAGLRREVFLPFPHAARQGESAAGAAAEPDVRGDIPVGTEGLEELFAGETAASGDGVPASPETARHWIGDESVETVLERHADPLTGYTRLTNPDLPFGLARLASEHVDFILVGRGSGPPPEFPSRDVTIFPPPGRLHH